jgi:precorrin-4/cobalt-precorrin-4 C11-methyltransferase
LDTLGIAYDVTPGVSSFQAAAATLHMEYTLPEVSQSVIITRMEGRTSVPERESIERFAVHHATMVIFLSTGMLPELTRRLLAGGYEKDTPAAIVYKASWPDERSYFCTVESLAETARLHGITKTALILVGPAVAQSGYARSKLYDPTFTTEFREGKQ